MSQPRLLLQVALPTPLHGCFDYLPPQGWNGELPPPGVRVRAPFGRKRMIGIFLGSTPDSAVETARLKHALEFLDNEPPLTPDILALARWASAYYHHPLGEVLAAALPAPLRTGQAARIQGEQLYRLTGTGLANAPETLRRAPKQAEALRLLHGHPAGMAGAQLDLLLPGWQPSMRALRAKGWVETFEITTPPPIPAAPSDTLVTLNPAQRDAAAAVRASLGSFQAFLLDGVTGSGKTEVYLRIIEEALREGRQALVLVPEIGLTPQLTARFAARLAGRLAVLHSGLSGRERLGAWLAARDGRAAAIIGTRSAVFTPLRNPGVIILDEEHDISFKQQEGFRYHARDLAVWRARQLNIPIVLGSATPSLESLYNVERGRYRHLTLPRRAGDARPPRLRAVDMRHQAMMGNLSEPLLQAMEHHLADGNQVLLFLNRRGYAPTLLCHDCGWVAQCRRCDAHLVYTQAQRRLRCHHCGAERPVERHCPACGSADLRAIGHGTERVEQYLHERFPQFTAVRIDRDSTRRRGALEHMLASAERGDSQLLIGTQMLAKGHHLPRVTLAAILEADQGLHSTDFRAPERLAQLIVQVAGRAGRSGKPGEVLIQTHHPDHPLLQCLLQKGYSAFAATALAERREAGLPPYSHAALLRAEATDAALPLRFLTEASAAAADMKVDGVEILGPVPSTMERRAGRYRAQLLLQSAQRAPLHTLLGAWLTGLHRLPSGRKVRWSLDVDPMETM